MRKIHRYFIGVYASLMLAAASVAADERIASYQTALERLSAEIGVDPAPTPEQCLTLVKASDNRKLTEQDKKNLEVCEAAGMEVYPYFIAEQDKVFGEGSVAAVQEDLELKEDAKDAVLDMLDSLMING